MVYSTATGPDRFEGEPLMMSDATRRKFDETSDEIKLKIVMIKVYVYRSVQTRYATNMKE